MTVAPLTNMLAMELRSVGEKKDCVRVRITKGGMPGSMVPSTTSCSGTWGRSTVMSFSQEVRRRRSRAIGRSFMFR